MASTSTALEEHVDVPQPHGRTVTCTQPHISKPKDPTLLQSSSSHNFNTSDSHHVRPLSLPPTLPWLQLPTIFTYPLSPDFQLQQSQHWCITFLSFSSSGLPDPPHVLYRPLFLATTHFDPSSFSLSHHSNSMAVTHHSHSHGQFLSISLGVGGDDDSRTSASHTSSLFKSISSLNPLGSPKTSGHKKSTQLTTKANLSGPWQHGLWKRRVTLPHIQLLDQGGAYVFDGDLTQQIGHNPPIWPTSNCGR